MTTFQKGDLVRRNDTIALVMGPADEREGLPLLVEGKRFVGYAPQWTLFKRVEKRAKGRPRKPPALTQMFFIQRTDEDGLFVDTRHANGESFDVAWNKLVLLCREYPGVAFRLVNGRGEEVTVPMVVIEKLYVCPQCGAKLVRRKHP